RRELFAHETDPRSPGRGQYAFVQALIREVAYNTLAKRDRKTRHLAAARFFEGLGSDELAGALANHYLAAQQSAQAGPEADTLAAQARVALKAAAERAFTLGSYSQAAIFFKQAIDVTDAEAERVEFIERAAWAAHLASEDDAALVGARQAVESRRALGDPDATAAAIAQLASILVEVLQPDAALELVEPAVRELIPDDAAVGPGGVRLLAQFSRILFFMQRHPEAVAVADRALEAAERLELPAVVSDVLITRGSALANLGRGYEGIGAVKAGVELADELGMIATSLRGRINMGVLSPDPRLQFQLTESALETARRYGLRGLSRTLIGNLSSAALEIGEWDVALRELDAGIAESTEGLETNFLSWARTSILAWQGVDNAVEVERLVEWANSLGNEHARGAIAGLRAELAFAAGDHVAASDGWILSAQADDLNAPLMDLYAGIAALLGRDRDRSEAALVALRTTPTRFGRRMLDERVLVAGLAILDGQFSAGLREARSVMAEFGRLGMPWRQALIGLVLATLMGGDDPEVRAAAQTARETFERLGAKPFIAQLDSASTNRRSEPVNRVGVRPEAAGAAVSQVD
ncbi:MAG: hypothetical protein ABIZ34_07310, partial [Candidatus Limnocylindrales bacterium]